TESDGHRQVGGRPAALDELLGTLINLVLSAGDTHVGGRVDEAATGVGGHLQPLHGGGLSRQVDRIQVVFFTSDLPAASHLRKQIRDDAAQATSLSELGGEALRAVLQHRVPVGHDHAVRAGLGGPSNNLDGVLDL